MEYLIKVRTGMSDNDMVIHRTDSEKEVVSVIDGLIALSEITKIEIECEE